MKTLKLVGIVPFALLAAGSFAQDDNRAVPRGSSSSSSSDAGSRHSGGSSSSSSAGASSSSNSGGGSSWSGSDQSSRSSDAAARRPRPGTGSGTRDRYGNDRGNYGGDRYRSYPYSSYYYDPYAYSWGSRYRGYGYGYGYYDYGFGYGDYYGYYPSTQYRSYRYRSGNVAQIRTLVEPRETRVYVDGYYAGIVDDFDGLLQRLNMSPGRHEITLRLEGYRSHTFAIYASRDQTLKLRWDMVRGTGETRDTAGEYDRAAERRDDRDDEDRREAEQRDRRDDARDLELDRERENDSARQPVERGREVDSDRRFETPSREAGRGEVLLDIEPGDASVYIDGEFYGKASQLTRVELSPGRHRIEVVRPGFRTEETEVEVTGESKRVVVKLGRR